MLTAGDRREQELVFASPLDGGLNDAVKQPPGRWFDWRRKHWRVPADPRVAKPVEDLLERFPRMVPRPDVTAWLSDSDRWRGLVSVVIHEDAGAFIIRTLVGDQPDDVEGATAITDDRLVLPFTPASVEQLDDLDGAELDDLARGCARDLRAGRMPPPAELSLEVGDDGEPELTLATIWNPELAREFKKLSESHPVALAGRFFNR